MSFFSAGVGALNNAQLGLSTAGHNINNVNTAGFHRQENVQVSNIPLGSGSGFIGQGAHIVTIKRVYNQFLDSALSQAQTKASQLNSYVGEINQIDSMLADATTGVSPALQGFFKAVGDVSTNPESVPARQALMGGANALVARFNTIAQRFAELTSSVNSQIAQSVGQINTYAQQIATINNQILFQSAGTNQPPNDLLDQRDALIADLNKQIRTTTITQSDGSISLFIGTGQPLVVGPQVFPLEAIPTPEDQQRIGVAYAKGNVPLPDSTLTGGTLGGLLDYRANALYPAENSLGRVALGLAQSFNDQHRLGQDLAGNSGGDFFRVPTFGAIPSTSNLGTGTINTAIVDIQSLTTSDYRMMYTGTAGSEYNLIRLSDNRVTTFSAAKLTAGVTVDGITYTSSGAPIANDSFTIQPTRYAARDLGLSSTINATTIAASAPISASDSLANQGSGAISAGTVNPFNDKVTLAFTSATAFDVVDVTTGITLAKAVPYTSGSNISYNGWTTKITNGAGPTTPLAGDVFTIDRTLTSTTSATASIAVATVPSAPASPTDPFLKNSVQMVFDTATSYHLKGLTSNVTGVSSIAGGTFTPTAVALGALVLPIANPGIVVTNGTAIIGTGGAGAYGPVAGTKTTISGGTLSGVSGTPPYTVTGATVTVEGGGKSTTFSGLTITIDPTTGAVNIPAVSGTATASTFNGQPATGLTFTPNVNNPLSVNGWSVVLSGAPVAGDTFTISANGNGISDSRNALLLAQVQTKGVLVGGTTNIQDAYAEMVNQVGNQTAEAQVTSKAQDTLVQQATAAQQSISGVNLDEEAANLLKYQQAYQAAGKMMTIAATLFDVLLAIGK